VVGGLGDAPDNVPHHGTQCGNVVHNRSTCPIVDQRFTQKNLIHCLPLLWGLKIASTYRMYAVRLWIDG
jgi:hypothetical protein